MTKLTIHFILLLSLLSFVKSSLRKLLDVENPKFFNPNDQVKVEFGFSLALFVNETHRSLLVGAPLANTTQTGVNSPGALYNCDLLTSDKDIVYCSQLVVDSKTALEKYSSYISEDSKDFQRLGASLATMDNKIVVCAPNWHYFEMRLDSPIDTPVGTCYVSSSLENFEQFSVPYDLYGDQSIDYLRTGSCQSGFSAAMTQNFNSVLGSPGCFNWQGDVFAGQPSTWTQFGKNFTEEDFGGEENKKVWISNKYVGYSVAQGIFNNIQGVAAGSPRATNTPKNIKQPNKEDLLIISPMVNIFLEDQKWLNLWMNLLPPTNSTGQVDAVWLFSYFGYAVAVADVDGNGLDDVIVGAPFYHNSTQKDQGAIVVYLQEVVDILEVTQQKFRISMERNKNLRVGLRDNGRFGSCVSPIGDIDGDGFQDIAVGAPFSPDGGQVYIFLGSNDGLPDLPLYIISASDPYLAWKNLNNFGAAIAPRFMMQDGSQTDLAIGSVASDTVVIFISKVMIAVDWSLKFPEKMDLRSKCALKRDVEPCTEIVTCLSYNFLEKGKHEEDVRPKEFILDHKLDFNASPKRLFFENEKTTKSKSIYIEFNKMVCFYDKVYTSRQIENFDPFEIVAGIKHIPRLKDDKSSLHSRQEKKKSELLDIVVQCNGNEISQCECATSLQSHVFPTVVDASDVKLNVSYEITNTGEPAYSMRLLVKTDDYLVTSGKPIVHETSTTSPVIDCRKIGKGTLECYLGNFVNDFDLLRFSLVLTTTHDFLNASNLRHHQDQFKVASSLTSLSTFKDPSAVMTENFVHIKVDPQLSLTKDKSTNYVLFNDSDQFVYPEDAGEDFSAIGPLVSHVYNIFNPENYVIENNEVSLYWPLKIKGNYLLYRMALPAIPGVKSVLEKCKKSNERGAILDAMETLPFIEDITWFVLTCNVAAFKPGKKVAIDISSRLVLKTIRNDVASLEFDEIYSFMTIKSSPKLMGQEYRLSYINHIPTEIDYGDHNFNQIKWWMVLVATLLACFILAIIIFVLCKFNFFKRKKVEPTEVLDDKIASPESDIEIETNELQALKGSEAEVYDNVNLETVTYIVSHQ